MTTGWIHIEAGAAADLNGPVARPCTPLTDEERAMPLFALIERRAEATPDKIALVMADRMLTYRELVRAACGLAERLLRAQAGDAAPVCVWAPQGSVHMIAGLACLRLGMPYAPLDPAHSAVRNLQIAVRSGARVLVCRAADRAAAAAFAPRARIVVGDDAEADPGSLSCPYPGPDVPVTLFFTSGSTGIPKGVTRTVGSFMSTIDNRIRGMHHHRDDRFGYIGGPSVAGPLQLCVGVLALGARFCLSAATAPLDTIMAMLREQRATMLHCGIGMLRLIARHPEAREALAEISGVRTVGDVVEWRDVAALFDVLPPSAFIYCNYAATESSQMAGWFVPRDLAGRTGRVPLGYPARDADLWIDTSTAGEGDRGTTGELMASSSRLAAGYWNDPQATATAFTPHPLDPGRRMYRTGDLVWFGEDGLLHFLGRVDNQVKLHGWRIELEEIEAAARGYSGVTSAGVAPRRDAVGKVAALALHVAVGSAQRFSQSGLMSHLLAVLPRHMVPGHVVVTEGLPETASGKIDRLRLAEIDAQAVERSASKVRPDDAGWPDGTSRRIADMFAREAKVAACGPDDRFADLGGDSLKALHVALVIEKTFGVTIDPTVLLGEATLGEIVSGVARSSQRLAAAKDAPV